MTSTAAVMHVAPRAPLYLASDATREDAVRRPKGMLPPRNIESGVVPVTGGLEGRPWEESRGACSGLSAASCAGAPESGLRDASLDGRLARMIGRYSRCVATRLRRRGIREVDIDDAVQQVFCIALRRIECIEPGCERAFLLGTAVRVASDARRAERRRGQWIHADTGCPSVVDWRTPDVEEIVDHHRKRKLLQAMLEAMPAELRTVVSLHEFDALTMAEIAQQLSIPAGTVASRLREARRRLREGIAAQREAAARSSQA